MESIIFQLEKLANQWLEFIVTSSLQFSFFLLVIAALAFLLRKQSAKFLYLLWLIGLFKLLLPPDITLPEFFGTTQLPVAPFIFVLPVPELAFAVTAAPTAALSCKGYLFLVWILGILLFCALWIVNNFRFHRRLKSKSHLLQSRTLISKHYLLNSNIKFYTGKNIAAPFTRGIFKPKIFLPQQALAWAENERWAVVLHEYAHIKRKDVLAIAVQNLLQIVYFFHPLVWLANIQIAKHREKACDDFAIHAMKGNAVEYCKYLMNSINKTMDWQPMPSMSNYFSQSKKFLLKRFEYILNRKGNAMKKLSSFQKFVFLSLVILGVAFACHKQNLANPIPFAIEKSQQPNNQLNVFTESMGNKNVAVNEIQQTGNVVPSILEPAIKDTEQVIFVPYDEPPQPIGGFAAIQKNLHYPEIARKAGIEGTVVVAVKIDTQGVVTGTKLEKSLGENNGCDEAAIEAIKLVKWEPAKQRDKAVAVRISVPVKFKLAHDDDKGLHLPGANINTKASLSGSLLQDASEKLPCDTPAVPINGYKELYKNLRYPEIARKTGVEGTLTIYTKVDKTGKVIDTKLIEAVNKTGLDETTVDQIKESVQKPGVMKGWVSITVKTDESGNEVIELDESAKLMVLVEAAIKAINETKWHPAYFKGEAVDSWLAVPIQFKLSDNQDTSVIEKQIALAESDSIQFVPYDVAPQPIGGFKAIQEKVYYPELAQQAGIEGMVIVYARIDEKGQVIDTRVTKPLGNSGCNEAAIQAIKSVKWKPALQKDKPVTVWVSVPVKFSLK